MSNNSTDEQFKVCPKCKIRKHVSEYHKSKDRYRGISSTCRECRNKANRESYIPAPPTPTTDNSLFDIETTFKKCGCCKESKPLKDYAPNKGGKFGRHSKCRECVNAMHHEKREERLEARRKAREENPEHYKQYAREYKKRRPDVFRNSQRKSRALKRDWRSKNPERNRETSRKAARKWFERHPEIYKLRKQMSGIKYREVQKIKNGDCSSIWHGQEGKCWYCHQPLELGPEAHLEHVIPLIQGGTNERNNLRWSCGACNRAKQGMTPLEFMGRLF